MGDSVNNHYVGPFERISKIAESGLSTLWLACMPAMDTPNVFVLKELSSRLRKNASAAEAMYMEGAIGQYLSHPNVCSVRPAFLCDDSLYLPMQFVPGESLRFLMATALRANHLPSVEVIVDIATQVARGLAHIHSARDHHNRPLNVIHRDISAANIMIGFDGCVRLIDFGVAHGRLAEHLRDEGQLRGKFSYMSPEQVLGLSITQASDIFSLGTTLWEHLTGRPLFRATSPVETALRIATMEVTPASDHRLGIPSSLDKLVLRCLNREPEARPSAEELSHALEDVRLELAMLGRTADVIGFVNTYGANRMRWVNDTLGDISSVNLSIDQILSAAQISPSTLAPTRARVLEQSGSFVQISTAEHAAVDPLNPKRSIVLKRQRSETNISQLSELTSPGTLMPVTITSKPTDHRRELS